MKYYFTILYKILRRHCEDFGVKPMFAFIGGILFFFISSTIFFTKTTFASYIYLLIGVFVISSFNTNDRTYFLKSIFPNSEFVKIRLIENILIGMPFFLFLFFKSAFLEGCAMIVLPLLITILPKMKDSNIIIPSPFLKFPWEYIIGFRKIFLLIPLVWFLTYQSIKVDNLNLGIFSLIILFFGIVSFGQELESDFYVWIFNKNANGFLIQKIVVNFLLSSILLLPIIVALLFYFSNAYFSIVGFYFLIQIYFCLFILFKYTCFPSRANLGYVIFLGLSFAIPPIIIFTIPYFYKSSIKNLSKILK